MSYTKLFSHIVTSSIWTEDDQTRILWITMLAIADKHGEVMASIPGLARVAGLSVNDTEAGLKKFLGPDPYSRTPDDEGRRIEEIPGGWSILNYAKHRRMASIDEEKEKNRERQRKHRARARRNEKVTDSNGCVTKSNAKVTPLFDNAEAEAEAEAEADINSTPSLGKGVQGGGEKIPDPPAPPSGASEEKLKVRFAEIVHRRPGTKWTPKELRALKHAGQIEDEDMAALEAYYSAHWPPSRHRNILRHDLATLLNNISGEIDRAHADAAEGGNGTAHSAHNATTTNAGVAHHFRGVNVAVRSPEIPSRTVFD